MINPFEMMKNIQEMKNLMAQIKCTGYSMGNMVQVVASGELKIESIKIDPSLVKEGQEGLLEVLVTSAVNSAFEAVREKLLEEAKKMGGRYGVSL